MVRRRFFLFGVILSCWARWGKTPGKAAKAKERATQETFFLEYFFLVGPGEGEHEEKQQNGFELCFLGESTTPPLYLRGRRYPFERFEPKYLLLMHALPEPNLQCMMRPYYYHLGGVRRDTLEIGNPITNPGGGGSGPPG